MKRITKIVMGVMMALTLTVGTATQAFPFISDNSTAIVAEAANGVITGRFNGYS